jgi:serine/threonine protein kinase
MRQKIGRVHVLGTLGKGANSTILHVRRVADGRQYALKLVPIGSGSDSKYQEQAEHEYRVAQLLDHPNLIKIYALEKRRGWSLWRVRELRLLIEYVKGRPLDAFPRLPLAQLVQVFVQAAAGLVHMHRSNVCHADLKPHNILLSRTGEVKIIDYGLAWIKGMNKARVQGTLEYMAPEQARERRVDERTDIFNFGATMYRLLTWRHIPLAVAEGGLPLSGRAWEAMLRPVREVQPDVPAVLAELIHRCLAYDPQQRPQRASEVQGALDHLADRLVRSPDDRLEALDWQD